MPSRLIKLDLVDRLSPFLPKPVAQLIMAFSCAALAVLMREVMNIWLPNAGPFALTFPFVLLATLFGRWPAGVGVMIFSAVYAWYYVLPVFGSFTIEDPRDGPRIIVNCISSLMIVCLGEFFRRFAREAVLERDAIAEERQLLLSELDHRVKNNFAMMKAIVRLEARNAPKEAAESLTAVGGRIESIVHAHSALYRGITGEGLVPMRPYLDALCSALDEAYLEDRFGIKTEIEPLSLPSDTAIAIGLVVNELCTNAAKYAFPGRDRGQIEVKLSIGRGGIEVSIQDDGVGFPDDEATLRKGSLGQGLVQAFADQAGGTLQRVRLDKGTRFLLKLPREETAA